MIALAVILLVLAAALVVGVAATGTSQQVVFDSTVGSFTTQPIWIFVAGVVAARLALLGISLLGKGTRRRVSRRREMKRLRKVEQEQAARREAEATTAERTERADRTNRTDRTDTEVSRAGYDEPDRHLVREPRTGAAGYDPEAGEHLTSSHARPADANTGTSAETQQDPIALDEPARHRQP